MKIFRRFLALLLAFLATLCLPGFTQQSKAGEQALANKNWTSAEKFFRDALHSNANDGYAWFELGEALYGEQKFAESADAFKHAGDKNFQNMRSEFHQAKSLARAGDSDRAFAVLEDLNRQGFPSVHALTSDDDFKPMQSDKRWQDIVAATTANANPCEHSTENRQFDFWIGEWNVETTTGQPAGTSRVERILNGCALLENWSGGGDGKSLNIYNANKKQWQQFWVDSGGEVHEYAGNLVNGEMRFEGPASDHDGNRTMRRMTFSRLDGGRIKQKGEVSKDGTVWSVEYELIYVPKK
jgi:tetratricopeptide (TPR) repeat protein